MNLLYLICIKRLCPRSKFAHTAIKGVLKIITQFGSTLKKMRKGAGMSQEDIALDLHMSISNISRLESEKYELKAADLFRWTSITQNQELLAATILGIDVGVLQQALDLVAGTTTIAGLIFIGGI